MNHDEFTRSVLRTANPLLSQPSQLNNALFGLTGEVGEIVDSYKKHLFQGHSKDLESIKNEVGDVLYYLFLLAATEGFTIEECMKLNKTKLEHRYPESFTSSQSIHRS